MRRHPLLLLSMTLGMTLLGSVNAEGEPSGDAGGFDVLANSTLSCSTVWPSATVGCFWERPILVIGDVELAVGVDAQAVLTGSWDAAHLAPYVIVAYYGPQLGAWAEVRPPELSGVPVLGSPDWLRIGVSYRWGP